MNANTEIENAPDETPAVSTIIEVDGLPGIRLTLEILGMSADDVAEARRQAAACNVDHELVKKMAFALIEGFGLEPTGPEWAVGEMATVYQALGLLPAWASAIDVELAHVLQGGAPDVR